MMSGFSVDNLILAKKVTLRIQKKKNISLYMQEMVWDSFNRVDNDFIALILDLKDSHT